MLQSYLPIYQMATELQRLKSEAEVYKLLPKVQDWHDSAFRDLLETIVKECPKYGFDHTAALATRSLARPLPKIYADMVSALTFLNDSLSNELEKESVFRIPFERKNYFERDDLFGAEVAAAFPSCAPDIQGAGNCYALGQGDACVHHLMMVLERGLNALAVKVGVPYERTNWQTIIGNIKTKVDGSVPKGPERDFYLEVNGQFGLLKDVYRNHSEHVRDERYDMPKTLHILNHVCAFMLALEKGRLHE
jgi:hypothetical protein